MVKICTTEHNNVPFKLCIKLTFKIQNIFVTGIFYVRDKEFSKEYNMMLGYGFLKSNYMLDCQANKLKIEHNTLYIINSNTSSNLVNVLNITHKNKYFYNKNFDKFPTIVKHSQGSLKANDHVFINSMFSVFIK